jgi:hypothetical protein
MDDADYQALRHELELYGDTVMRLRAQWSTLPEPTLWSGPAHVAALGQLRQGPEKLSAIGVELDRAINECNRRIEQARTEASVHQRLLMPW